MIPDHLGLYRMTDIHLTKPEMEYLRSVGRSRNRTNRRSARTDLKVDADGVGIDEQGAIGEGATCRFFDMPVTYVKDTKPFRGADIVTKDYGTVAVKCRNADERYLGGFLKSPHLNKECSADWACLTWIVGERIVRIVGLLSRRKFNRLVKHASEYGVTMPRDGWYVPWQYFCGTQ